MFASYAFASVALIVSGGISGAVAERAVPNELHHRWSDFGIGIMYSFDMISTMPHVPNPQHFCIQADGDPPTFPVPPASTYNPSNFDTDQWMEAAKAVGAKYSVFVALHCSGFAQWRSKVYNYSVTQTDLKFDPLRSYLVSSQRSGVHPGLYIAWNYNYLYNVGGGHPDPVGPPTAKGQIEVTGEEFRTIMRATMAEAWEYAQNGLAELWFDGDVEDEGVATLAKKLQRFAISIGGQAGMNPARIAGSESSYVPYPTWPALTPRPAPPQPPGGEPVGGPLDNKRGSPYGLLWAPPEADAPVSNTGWFWKPSMTYRTRGELIAEFHNSWGVGANMLIGVMPNSTGLVPDEQLQVLRDFNEWRQACYNIIGAGGGAAPVTVGKAWEVPLLRSKGGKWPLVDRVVLAEDLTKGINIINYTIRAQVQGYIPTWIEVATGTLMGIRRVVFFTTGPVVAKKISVTVNEIVEGGDESTYVSMDVFEPCPYD